MDQMPAFGLSVFSQGAQPQPQEPASPVSDLASTSPVAPPTEFSTQTEENATAKEMEDIAAHSPGAPSLNQLYWTEESSIAALNRMMQSNGFEPDFSWRLPSSDSDDYKELMRGIPDEYRQKIALSAVSAQHAQFLSGEVRHEMAADQELARHSTMGRIGMGLLDPANILMSATGGPEVSAGSRITRFLISGVRTAAENAALTAFLDADKPTADGHDIAAAALTGFGLGGSIHAILPPSEAARAGDNLMKARRQLAINELADHIEQGNVPESAVEPKALAEVKALQATEQAEQAARDINTAVDAQRDNLVAEASGLDRQNDLRSAQRELTQHEFALTDAEASHEAIPPAPKADELLPDIVERMAREDSQTHGDEAAASTRLSKERQRAAELEARESARDAQEQYQQAKGTAQERIDTAQDRVTRQRGEVDRMQRALEAQKALKAHDSAVEKAGGDPQKLVKVLRDDAQRTALEGRLSVSPATPSVQPLVEQGGAFGSDSASAARATAEVAPAVELNPSTSNGPVPQSFKFLNIGPFKTFSSVLRGNSNPVVRSRLGRMFGEAIAARDASSGTVGASDHAQVLAHAWHAEVAKIEYAHKGDWMNERGYSPVFQRYSPRVQQEWEREVGRTIRGFESTSKAAKEAAGKYSKLFKQVLDEAKRAGVKGLENVSENGKYLPRVFDYDTVKSMNRVLGDRGMTQFLADAMEKTNMSQRLDRSGIETIAKGYLQRVKRLGLGVDSMMMHGPSLDDLEVIRGLLHEAPEVSSEEVDSVINQLKARASEQGQGSVRYAKSRVSFDETHTMSAGGQQFSIADMWRNDARTLAERYVRTMSGATGLARMGIKSDSDFLKSLAESLSSMDEAGMSKEERKTVESYARGGYNLILGRPLDNEGFGTFQKMLQLSRDYAYTRSMNQAGFSIANNLVRPWTNGYAKYSSKYLPELVSMLRRGDNGELNNPLMREIERFTGIGTDSIGQSWWSHFETDSNLGRAMQAVGQKLKVAGSVTSHISGMTPGLVFGQRLMSVGILDRIVRHAFGEASIPAKRLSIMGLDEPMMNRILAQLREHAPETEGRNAIRSVNWANWTDFDARDALLTAINRETRILIHGEDIASTGLWMNKGWGRLAIQMRRFPMMAMSKQLGRALHMRDADTLMDFMVTGTLGALSAAAQYHLRSIGMDEQTKQQYLDKNLSLGHLIAAGVQRNPYSAMFPQLIDTLTTTAGFNPVFDARGSDLSGNMVSGTPVVDALSKLSSAFADPVRRGGFSQREWKALTAVAPLGNSFPMVWLTNAMADNFPKSLPRQPRDPHRNDPLLQSAVDDE